MASCAHPPAQRAGDGLRSGVSLPDKAFAMAVVAALATQLCDVGFLRVRAWRVLPPWMAVLPTDQTAAGA